MHKKIFAIVIAMVFIFSAVGLYAAREDAQPTAQPLETTKVRMSRAMNNIFLGPVEIPKNLNETTTKGTKIDRGTEHTKDGVGRGIARVFTGVWQLATFWYSEPGPSENATATK